MRRIIVFFAFSFVFLLSHYGFSAGEKVNINTATPDQLVKLPGIGKVLAQRIVEYRAKTPFKTIDEIKNIKGIGDKEFAKIKDLITVGGPGEGIAPTKETGTTAAGATATPTPAKKKRGKGTMATPVPTPAR